MVKVPLFPEKNTPIDLSIKAYVGSPGSNQLHVFEACRPLPRFALYIPCGLDAEPRPRGYVTFNLSERLDRVCLGSATGKNNSPIFLKKMLESSVYVLVSVNTVLFNILG